MSCRAAGIHFAKVLVALLGTVTLANCQTSPRGESEAGELHTAIENEIPALMQRAIVPGLSIALLRDGRVAWHGAFGVRDTASEDRVTDETVFEAASLSKPVFAYAVLRLVSRGELDLDTPLWDTLPYERLQHEDRARKITARMVLSHQTGLPNWGARMVRSPGERWSYSGEGYVFLQRTIEKLTGLGLQDFVQGEVFGPLGMSSSSFVWREPYRLRTSHPHDYLGVPRSKRWPAANAASSLHTTAADYARFLAEMFSSAEPAASLARRMLEPQVETSRGGSGAEAVPTLHWSLGWGLQDGPKGRAFWHWGSNGTFRCYVVGYPGTGDGLVYFTNSQNGLAILHELVHLVFPDDEHHAIEFLGSERYDDPARQLRIKLERTFLEEGGEAGVALYRQLGPAELERVGCGATLRLAGSLVARGHAEAAIELYEANAARFPDRADSLRGLAQATLDAGQLGRSLEVWQRLVELDPDDEHARHCVAWAELGMATIEIPKESLQRCVGVYGPHLVTLDGAQLIYQREGRDSYSLVALANDTFVLRGLPRRRLRFVDLNEGRFGKVIVLDSDGSSRESVRTP